jgi:alpha-ketoglutarate-dependent taurine dioxygenase
LQTFGFHPETVKRALFLSSGLSKAIPGLTPSESTKLLDYLNEELSGHADCQVRFGWTPTSIAVSDNRAVSRFGLVDGPFVKKQRIVRRTTVGDDLPFGADSVVSRPPAGELFNVIS